MNPNAVAIGIYQRLYPIAVLLCAGVGAVCFAEHEPLAAAHNFLAIGFGVRLDERIRWRWFQRSETEASHGWARARVPVAV